MSRSARLFSGWFGAVLAFFVAANAAGAVRPTGLKPFRAAGFPFPFAVWGVGVEEFTDLRLLALIGAIAVAVAGLVSWAICRRRSRTAASVSRDEPRPSTEPPALESSEPR